VNIQLPREVRERILSKELNNKPNLKEVLSNKHLAALGDSYLNLLYSISLSLNLGRPAGNKLKGSILCTALRDSGLRRLLPKRFDRHSQANALEALAAYTWIEGVLSFKSALKIFSRHEDPTMGMTNLALKMTKAFEKHQKKNVSLR